MKTAVVLFNLGGPDRPEAARPFLQNMFRDRAIIDLPKPLRYFVAWLIAWRRAPITRAMYAKLGHGSPLLPNTEAQAAALSKLLPDNTKVFIAMRYWHPMSEAVTKEVKAWGAEQVILLPLYPQYSTTSTGSSFDDWMASAKACGLNVHTRLVREYPTLPGFVDPLAEALSKCYKESEAACKKAPRILFSAHGLPESIVKKRKDPYPKQVLQSAEAVVKAAGLEDADWKVSYQSRVGPQKWIEPYTDKEIEKAGKEKIPLIVLPIAFVSEHLETLEELDKLYGKLAKDVGVPRYDRLPTVGTSEKFIAGLAEIVKAMAEGESD